MCIYTKTHGLPVESYDETTIYNKRKFSNLISTLLSKFYVLVWNYKYPFFLYIESELLTLLKMQRKLKCSWLKIYGN